MKHDHTFWKSSVWRSAVNGSLLTFRLQELAECFRSISETGPVAGQDDPEMIDGLRNDRRDHGQDGQYLAGKGELVFEGEVLETSGWGVNHDR